MRKTVIILTGLISLALTSCGGSEQASEGSEAAGGVEVGQGQSGVVEIGRAHV